LVLLAVSGLPVGMVVASADPRRASSQSDLSLSTDAGSTPLFHADNMTPGPAVTNCVQIRYQGADPGAELAVYTSVTDSGLAGFRAERRPDRAASALAVRNGPPGTATGLGQARPAAWRCRPVGRLVGTAERRRRRAGRARCPRSPGDRRYRWLPRRGRPPGTR